MNSLPPDAPEPLPPIPLARLRAVLAAQGAAPRKRHGQHFLHDTNLLAAIVRDGTVGADDTVLEVGPGPGLLTRHLLATGARVLAVEIDPAMTAVAAQLVEPRLSERLTWFESDAMAGGRRLSQATEEALGRCTKFVANLPYQISGPLLGGLLVRKAGPDPIVAMVQREMAERLLGSPGQKSWGPLGVLAALGARGAIRRRVPPGAFWPVPKVDSAVVVLERRADQPGPEDLDRLQAFLPLAFHTRRKTLVNSVAAATGLKSGEVTERLGKQENVEKLRAEAFDELELLDLARHWASHASGAHERPDPG